VHYQNRSTGGEADRFVTWTKSDPEFLPYLKGTFSRTFVALPTETFGVSSSRERVTFRVVPRGMISRPARVKIFLRAIRAELLHLTLVPPLLVWMASGAPRDSLAMVVSALLSITALHASAFLFNDYSDHVQGIDRLRHRRGSQVIQRGWMSAASVYKWAWTALSMAIVLSVPAVLLLPHVAIAAGFIAVIALLGFSGRGRGLKYKGFGDVLIFMCFGPLLTWGSGFLVHSGSSFQLALLGAPLGLIAVLFVQSRQLESIMAEREARTGTLVGRLGFDRARSLLLAELIVLVPLSALPFFWISGVGIASSVLMVGVGVAVLVRRLRSIASPLSSRLVGWSDQVRIFHALISLVWFILFAMALWWTK